MSKKSRIILIVGITALLLLLALVICSVFRLVEHELVKDALFEAIANNDIETLDNLLSEHPDMVNVKITVFDRPFTSYRDTLLTEAIKKESSHEIIFLLVEKYHGDVNRNDKYDYPITLALRNGDYQIAWYLIEQGADLFITSEHYGCTVPFSIVFHHIEDGNEEGAMEQLKLLKYVIDKGVSIDGPEDSEYPGAPINLLGKAACSNNWIVVDYLLNEKLFDVNDRVTETRQTALIAAAERRAYSTCRVLLEHGADPFLKDDDGKMAIAYAVQNNDEDLISLLEQQ